MLFWLRRRTCCWNIAVRVPSRWLTLEARATLTSAFTRTSNRVSTDRLKSYSACLTVHPLTCGVSVRSFIFFQLLLLIVFVLFWRFSASWVIHFLFCYRGDRSVTDGRSNRSRILSRYLKKFQIKSTEPVAGRSEKIEKKTRKFLHFFYYYCCFFFVYYLSFSHFLALSM